MEPHALFLAAPFGTGHLYAAQAAAEAWQGLAPDWRVTVSNASPLLVRGVAAGYLELLQWAPGLYRRLYQAALPPSAAWLIRRAFLRPVIEALRTNRPTVVIATHPFPGRVAAHLKRKGRLNARIAFIVTDFLPHRLWVCPGVDQYFVATSAGAARLRDLGVPPERISVSGIPIRAAFDRPIARPLETGPERHVLVMGGGLGLGPIAEAVGALAAIPRPELRVTVVCGRNEALRSELQEQLSGDHRFRLLGETDQVPDLMREADLLISKPGGLTCCEALASGLPLVLLAPLPGQEEENAEALLLTGAARIAPTEGVGGLVDHLLWSEAAGVRAMRQCAQSAGRPGAARSIATTLLGIERMAERTGS
ncbi:MAG TPA: glycosyltransferase [Symbiobacteriaceae bacterium]|nr:glycosyltransferase [Symbiobacteriaceae bacterium]